MWENPGESHYGSKAGREDGGWRPFWDLPGLGGMALSVNLCRPKARRPFTDSPGSAAWCRCGVGARHRGPR